MDNERGKFIPEEADPERNQLRHFKENIAIGELPYIFEGDVPSEPADFGWSVIVPHWEVIQPKVVEILKMGEVNPRFEWFSEENLSIGRVGVLKAEKIISADQIPSIGILAIQSETSHLPTDSGYRNARGIGSFLLDNLCALADIHQWRIFLRPYDRGGRLTQSDLYKWYRKRGFEQAGRENYGSLQRFPRETETSQAIAKIIFGEGQEK